MFDKSLLKVTEANLSQAKKLYLQAKEAYYNGDREIMTDRQFDKLEDGIREADPEWAKLKATGVRVKGKKKEVKLHHYMPSLNKMYPHEVDAFYKRPAVRSTARWLVMDKLDGTSLQLKYKDGDPHTLYTRGDGELGKDVSYFIPFLFNHGIIPKSMPRVYREICLRIEGVMSEDLFATTWSKQVKGDKEGFDNSRQLLNGIFNRGTPHPAMKDIELRVLGIYGMPMIEGLQEAQGLGFDVVPFKVFKLALTAKELTERLAARRTASDFTMDGLVVCPARMPLHYEANEKPAGMIAFKVNDEENAAEVVVEEFKWQKTRLGRWQPKIGIPPTRMDGVTVTNATAHNPAWLQEQGIGPGAIVKVLRSGGVIPKIVGVVKKAEFVPPPGAYEQRGRFFYVVERDSKTDVRATHFFLVSMGIELLGEKSVEKLHHAFPNPLAYVKLAQKAAKDDLEALDVAKKLHAAGLGKADSAKVAEQLRKFGMSKVSLLKLMVASGSFTRGGVGERKLQQMEEQGLMCSVAQVLKYEALVKRLISLDGFQHKTAVLIANGMVEFNKFYAKVEGRLNVVNEKKAKAKVKAGPLNGLKVSWTTYRSKEQEQVVINNGGEVITFGAKTEVLLWDPNGKASTKVEKAGSKAMTWAQFTKKYNVKD